QEEVSKMEVGIQFSALRSGSGYGFENTSGIGGGARTTFNINKYIALEAETNYFPKSGFYNVSRWQGQFGVKSGLRFKQFGIFGKLRPGFMRTSYDEFVYIFGPGPLPPVVSVTRIREHHTGLSVDMGGVVEFYPSKRLTLRFDLGDTVVRQNEDFGGPVFGLGGFRSGSINQTTHHLQLSAGVGFRF